MPAQDFRALTNLDLEKNRVINAGLERFTSALPASPFDAQIGFSAVSGQSPDHAGVYVNTLTKWTWFGRINATETVDQLWTFDRGAGQPPFAVGALSTTKVARLNADLLDDFDSERDTFGPNSVAVRYVSGRLLVGTPVAANDAVTKAYVDTLSSGSRPIGAVKCATVSAVVGSYSSATDSITSSGNGPIANFASVFDTLVLVVNDRVLCKDQSSAFSNGVYYVSDAGSVGTPFVLKRTLDADEASEVTVGATVTVSLGSVNKGRKYRQSLPIANIDTDPENWVLDSVTDLIAGPGIVIDGTKISFVNSTGYARSSLFMSKDTATTPNTIVEEIAFSANKVLRSDTTKPYWGDFPTTNLPTLANGSTTGALTVVATRDGVVVAQPVVQNGASSISWAFTIDPNAIVSFGTPPGNTVYMGDPTAGSGTTALRSNAKLQIDPAIAPSWTGVHTFNLGISTLAPESTVPTYIATYDGDPSLAPVTLRMSTLATITGSLKIPIPATPSRLVDLGPKNIGTSAAGTAYLAYDCRLEIDQTIIPVWTGLHTWFHATPTTNVIITKSNLSGVATWAVTSGGHLWWGDGSGGLDTKLTRTNPGELTHDAVSVNPMFSVYGLKLEAPTINFPTVQFTYVPVWSADPNATRLQILSITKANFLTGLGVVPITQSITVNVSGYLTLVGNATQALTGSPSWVVGLPATIVPTWTGKHTFDATAPAVALRAGVATLSDTSYFLMTDTDPATATKDVVAASKIAFKNWIGDSAFEANGGIVPLFPTGTTSLSVVSGGAIGTGNFTVTMRVKWPTSNPAQTTTFIEISSSSTASTAFAFGVQVNLQDNLIFFWRDAGVVAHFSSVVTMTAYRGRMTDIVISRVSGVQSLFINGEAITYTPADIDDSPLANNATTIYFRTLSSTSGGYAFADVFYSARLFNRGLSQADTVELAKYGVTAADQWGTLSPAVPGCLIDLDMGGTCVSIIPNRSPSGDGSLTSGVEVIDGHLHCIGDVVSASTTAVPFVSNNRLTADATKMTWDGSKLNVLGSGYFQTSLGVGITPATTSWLELAAGTTAKAPLRMGIGAFLTNPVVGSFEADNTRPYYTNSVPTRRGIAFVDELAFTNDPNAKQEGGIIFGATDRVAASLTASGFTEDFGTDPFTLWTRFQVPNAFRGPSADGICGLGPSTTSAVANGFIMWMDSSGGIRGSFYGALGSDSRSALYAAFRSVYSGQIVDVVFVREGNVILKLYINGKPMVVTEVPTGTPPAWNNDLDSKYLLVGNSHSTNGSVTRIHRAVAFNRALTEAEVVGLSRYGVDSTDQWGTTKAAYTSDFTSVATGWSSGGGASVTLAPGQTVDGEAGWLTATRITTPGRAEIGYALSSISGQALNYLRRWRVAFDYYRTTAGIPSVSASLGTTATIITPSVGTTSGVRMRYSGVPPFAANISTTYTARVEPQIVAAGGTAVGSPTLPVGEAFSVKNVVFTQVGAVIDMDLAVGCGTAIPDRSGRYHGVMAGTTWYHYIAECPIDLPSGNGFVSYGLRRYVQKGITLTASTAVTITHNLNTRDVTVQCWQEDLTVTIPAKIELGVTAETVNTIKIWPTVIPSGAKATVIVVG